MAHFRGTVQGGRSEASRLGHKTSGLTVHANGWHKGITVEASYDEASGRDVFLVYLTGGSSVNGKRQLVGEYR
jgi:hypothetical protein